MEPPAQMQHIAAPRTRKRLQYAKRRRWSARRPAHRGGSPWRQHSPRCFALVLQPSTEHARPPCASERKQPRASGSEEPASLYHIRYSVCVRVPRAGNSAGGARCSWCSRRRRSCAPCASLPLSSRGACRRLFAWRSVRLSRATAWSQCLRQCQRRRQRRQWRGCEAARAWTWRRSHRSWWRWWWPSIDRSVGWSITFLRATRVSE